MAIRLNFVVNVCLVTLEQEARLTIVNIRCGWHMFGGEAMLEIAQYEIRFANFALADDHTFDCIIRFSVTFLRCFRFV